MEILFNDTLFLQNLASLVLSDMDGRSDSAESILNEVRAVSSDTQDISVSYMHSAAYVLLNRMAHEVFFHHPLRTLTSPNISICKAASLQEAAENLQSV